MKKIIKLIVILLILAFVGIQFVPNGLGNPPVNPQERLEATVSVPENVSKILKRSCYDCHSNETVYPWYSKIAPASWFLADHIKEGKHELNYSVWTTYEAKKKRKKLEETCEMIQGKEMPLPSYLWIHRDAILSDEDVKLVCAWTEAEIKNIPE